MTSLMLFFFPYLFTSSYLCFERSKYRTLHLRVGLRVTNKCLSGGAAAVLWYEEGEGAISTVAASA